MTGKYSLQWTPNLESLRRALRWLFNKCWTGRTPQSWELYREAQQRYSKEVRKASKEACRTFCNTVNDVLMSARSHRVLYRDPKIKVGVSGGSFREAYVIQGQHLRTPACYSLSQLSSY